MSSKVIIEDFLNQKNLAVVGVSRTGKKFSNTVFKNLKNKGYNVYPVNPGADMIDGDDCFKSLETVPATVDGIVVMTPKIQTEKVVRDAAALGIKRIWIQQGAESKEAITFCENNHIKVIHHECLLMFLEPNSFPHNIHRIIWKMLGKEPK